MNHSLHSLFSTPALFLVSVLLSNPAAAQGGGSEQLWQLDGSSTSEYLGHAVASAGDLDGDGIPDWLVSSRTSFDPFQPSHIDKVQAFSGATYAHLYTLTGNVPDQSFGDCMASLGDLDGDGRDDFIVGAPEEQASNGTWPGVAYVYSGASGTLLHKFEGFSNGDSLGDSVARMDDINGDGIEDILIGAPDASYTQNRAGAVYIFSGADFSLLYQVNGFLAQNEFGHSVACIGDLTGDGLAEVVIGAPGVDANSLHGNGRVYVISFATGTLLYQKDGGNWWAELGYSVAGPGDVDGVGTPDFMAGAPSPTASPAMKADPPTSIPVPTARSSSRTMEWWTAITSASA